MDEEPAERGPKESWLIGAPAGDELLESGWKQPAVGDSIVFFVHLQRDAEARYDSGDRPGCYVGAILSDGTKLGFVPRE